MTNIMVGMRTRTWHICISSSPFSYSINMERIRATSTWTSLFVIPRDKII